MKSSSEHHTETMPGPDLPPELWDTIFTYASYSPFSDINFLLHSESRRLLSPDEELAQVMNALVSFYPFFMIVLVLILTPFDPPDRALGEH
jgi:hypothetical protein